MFCSKCGAQNADNATFCQSCGSALGGQPQQQAQYQAQPQPQPQYQAQYPVQVQQPQVQQYDQTQYGQQYAGYGYQPQYGNVTANAKKKKLIAIAAVGLVAIAALVTALILIFGENGPEDVVEDHIEAMVDGDYDDMLDTLPEDILARLAYKEDMTEAECSMELREILANGASKYSTMKYDITYVEDLTYGDTSSLRSRYASMGYTVTAVKEVHVRITVFGYSNESDIKVVEIDGDWYVDYDEVF